MSEQHQAVMRHIQEHGPIVPNEMRQVLKLKDNFLTGALLSELMGEGLLSVTHMTHGTSKFYYETAKPESLELVAKHLGEKDRRAFELLKAEQVVRTADLTPLMRVAVSLIKDFSRGLILQTPEGEQEFYHYYLLSQEDAIKTIKKKYFGIEEKKKEEKVAEKPAEEKQAPVVAVEKPKKTRKPKAQAQTILPHESKPPVNLTDGFAKQVHDYFDAKQITLLQAVELKKTELSLVIAVPSNVGSVHYFCKAKAKKTTTDGDLASAHLEAQQHKLPLLYITAGTLTKKAQDLLQTQLKGIVVVQPWA